MTPKRTGYEGPERRYYENGNGTGGLLTGLPGWAKVIAVIGIPGAIAFFLVWVGAKSIPNIQEQIIRQGEQNKRIQELILDHGRQSEDLLRLMQRICANTAKDDTREQRCFDR